jgi:murein DD-endopeptidase MepM/ murein hydrolase activator NlpD
MKFKKGDTLSAIALKHGIKVSQLMAANPSIKNANSIKAGASYNLPPKTNNLAPPKLNIRGGMTVAEAFAHDKKVRSGGDSVAEGAMSDIPKVPKPKPDSVKNKRLADSILKTLKKKKKDNGGDSVAEGAMPTKDKPYAMSDNQRKSQNKKSKPYAMSDDQRKSQNKKSKPYAMSDDQRKSQNKKRGLFDKFSDFVKGEGKKISSDFGKAVKETKRNFSDKRYFVNGVDSRKEKIKSKSNITQKKKK